MSGSLDQLVLRVAPVLRQAGAAIMQHFRQQFTQREKSLGDFVTAADLASQEILIAGLTPLIPQAQFIAEEQVNAVAQKLNLSPSSISSQLVTADMVRSGQGDQRVSENQQSSDYCWVIDPLDGTNNFRHSLPRFAISVALTYQRQTILGCIYDPVQQELFYAIRGQGVKRLGANNFVNGADHASEKPVINATNFPAAVRSTASGGITSASLHNRLIATNFKQLINWEALELEGGIWRKFGCAALDLAYVSQGWIDVGAYEGLHWWDWAAGALLVQEAQLQFHQVAVPGGWGGGQQVIAGPAPLVARILQRLEQAN